MLKLTQSFQGGTTRSKCSRKSPNSILEVLLCSDPERSIWFQALSKQFPVDGKPSIYQLEIALCLIGGHRIGKETKQGVKLLTLRETPGGFLAFKKDTLEYVDSTCAHTQNDIAYNT